MAPNDTAPLSSALSKQASVRLTDLATSVGGSAALGLLAAAVFPEIVVVAGASLAGLALGYLASRLDKPQPAATASSQDSGPISTAGSGP